MKTLRTLLLIVAIGSLLSARAQDKKLAQLDIRTSSVCDMCEQTIETNLIYEKGVKKVDLNLSTNVIHVEYDPRKTSPEAIRGAVAKLGYYADDLPGDPKAFAELPACCQQEGCGKPAQQH